MSKYFIELKDVSKYYSNKDIVTLGLRKVNLGFNKGEFVAVCGESGSGKSTLMNVISGMDTYEDGEMFFSGEETSCFTSQEWDDYRRNNISFVFQDYNLIDSYTVLQNVELALIERFSDKTKRRSRALELIEEVGLTSHKKHKCTKLSGGQKQRVAIARALAKDAPILIADEPTGNLDEETSRAIVKLLAEVSKNKLLIVVTHSFDDLAEVATRKIRLYDGSVAEDKVVGKKSEISDESDDDLQQSVKNDWKKSLVNDSSIALANVFATPKKSIFVFSTFLIAGILILLYLLSTVNIILLSSEYNMNGNRKDTAIVFYEDRRDFEETDRETLNNIAGVKDSMLDYNILEKRIVEDVPTVEDDINYGQRTYKVLNVDSITKDRIEYGRKPENDIEIVLPFNVSQEPKEDMIGQVIKFYFNDNGYYSFGNGVEYSSSINNNNFFEFKIVGFTISTSCYLTTGAIENLSSVYNDYINNIGSLWFSSDTGINGNLSFSDLTFDDTINEANTIYIVYDRDDDYQGAYDTLLYDSISYFNSLEEDELGILLQVYNNNSDRSFPAIIKFANQNVNSEIYDEHYQGTVAIVMNPSLVQVSSSSTTSNSASIVLDVNNNINNTIARIEDAGYKVVYQYGAPLDPYSKIMLYAQLVGSFIYGIIIIGIATVLLSSIVFRVLKTKKKDYNVLRTLGMTKKTVNRISYMEFFLISTIAFLVIVVGVIILQTAGYMSSGYKLINTIYKFLPYGLYHYSTFYIFSSSYAFLMLLTFWVSRRFNRKLFKTSIKKTTVEN